MAVRLGTLGNMRVQNPGTHVPGYTNVGDMREQAGTKRGYTCSPKTYLGGRHLALFGGLLLVLGGTNLTFRADGNPQKGQKVSLVAFVANSETDIKIQFPKAALWGPYFTMFHCQQRNSN